jgi:hypothetical protein
MDMKPIELQMKDLNLITILLLKNLLHSRKCKLVVHSRFRKASKVCNVHFKIVDLIWLNVKRINTYKKYP